jgi:hypothetical protein
MRSSSSKLWNSKIASLTLPAPERVLALRKEKDLGIILGKIYWQA